MISAWRSGLYATFGSSTPYRPLARHRNCALPHWLKPFRRMSAAPHRVQHQVFTVIVWMPILAARCLFTVSGPSLAP